MVVLLTLALLAARSLAFDLPTSLRGRLPRAAPPHLGVFSPDEMTAQFLRDAPHRFVEAGCEGVVFEGRDQRAWKISLEVFRPAGPSAEWTMLRTALGAQPGAERIRTLLADRIAAGWPLKYGSLRREILGGQVWAAYNAAADVVLPARVSADGRTYQTRFVEGPSLAHVLKRDAAGDPAFAMPAVWAELVRLQKINERILRETGFAVDLFNPSNMLVTGPPGAPRLVAVDYSLAYPQDDVRAWFAAHGVTLPDVAGLSEEVGAFKFPTVAEQIVFSRLFNLTYEQALAYVAARFNVPTEDRRAVLTRLAHIPKWGNETYPAIMDHRHVDQARCELSLLGTYRAVDETSTGHEY